MSGREIDGPLVLDISSNPSLSPALVYRCLSLCCFKSLIFKSVRTAFSELSTAAEASSSAGRTCLSALLLPSSVCAHVCVSVWLGGWVGGIGARDLETNAEHYTQHLATCTYTHAQTLANSHSQPEAIDPLTGFILLTHIQILAFSVYVSLNF